MKESTQGCLCCCCCLYFVGIILFACSFAVVQPTEAGFHFFFLKKKTHFSKLPLLTCFNKGLKYNSITVQIDLERVYTSGICFYFNSLFLQLTILNFKCLGRYFVGLFRQFRKYPISLQVVEYSPSNYVLCVSFYIPDYCFQIRGVFWFILYYFVLIIIF